MQETGAFKKPAFFTRLLVLLGLIVLVLALSLASVSAYYLIKYRPLLSQLLNLHLILEKPMSVSLNHEFPLTATFNENFAILLNTEIPVKMPVSSILKIPIKETFQVPMDRGFQIKLDKPLHINQMIHVKGMMPLETEIEITLRGLGKNMTVPIKGNIPIDINFPLEQDLMIDNMLSIAVIEPLSVEIDQVVEAPINFIVEEVMPLNKKIIAPVKSDLPCSVDIKQDLPLVLHLDLSLDDWGKGIQLREQK